MFSRGDLQQLGCFQQFAGDCTKLLKRSVCLMLSYQYYVLIFESYRSITVNICFDNGLNLGTRSLKKASSEQTPSAINRAKTPRLLNLETSLLYRSFNQHMLNVSPLFSLKTISFYLDKTEHISFINIQTGHPSVFFSGLVSAARNRPHSQSGDYIFNFLNHLGT